MFPPGREAVAAVEGKRLRRMRSSEVNGMREEGWLFFADGDQKF